MQVNPSLQSNVPSNAPSNVPSNTGGVDAMSAMLLLGTADERVASALALSQMVRHVGAARLAIEAERGSFLPPSRSLPNGDCRGQTDPTECWRDQ